MFVSSTTLLIMYMLVVLVLRVVLKVVVEGDGTVPKALEIVASGESFPLCIYIYSCRSFKHCSKLVGLYIAPRVSFDRPMGVEGSGAGQGC